MANNYQPESSKSARALKVLLQIELFVSCRLVSRNRVSTSKALWRLVTSLWEDWFILSTGRCVKGRITPLSNRTVDRSQPLLYFVPQERDLTAKQARLTEQQACFCLSVFLPHLLHPRRKYQALKIKLLRIVVQNILGFTQPANQPAGNSISLDKLPFLSDPKNGISFCLYIQRSKVCKIRGSMKTTSIIEWILARLLYKVGSLSL